MSKGMMTSVVSVLLEDRKTIAGSGILIADDRVLTTAEIIGAALALSPQVAERPEKELFVELPLIAPGKPLKARVVQWLPASSGTSHSSAGINNIAILELLEPPPLPEPRPEAVRRTPTKTDYKMVVKAITEGALIPFFGAGVNLCGRPANAGWRRGQFLPSGQELAMDLAQEYDYPWSDTNDLGRVAQYVALQRGHTTLNRRLRRIFDANYPPTPLHNFFARLPAMLREKGYPPHRLIVTTNYDDVLESAFREAKEPFDLLTYVAHGSFQERGKFLHWTPEGEVKTIEKPNEYNLPLKNGNLERSAILKLHGAIDRVTGLETPRDSFVITEDHYIDYLTRSDISSLVPVTLSRKLRGSSFLFLGYGLRDWNLRVILHRIWMEQQQDNDCMSWAIQLNPDELETKMWKKRLVEIYHASLDDYIEQLTLHVGALPVAPPED